MDAEQKKILIVDDQKEYLQTAVNYIIEESFSYVILGAPNGKVALEVAQAELPDIIIMDWEMPEMNGIETIRNLKSNPETEHIPVIMSTGIRLLPNDLKIAFEAGASDFIRKPLEKTEFIARINSHLKLAEYINEVRIQEQRIAEEKNKRLQDVIETMNVQLEDSRTQFQFYSDLLTNIGKQIDSAGMAEQTTHKQLSDISASISISKRDIANILSSDKVPDNEFIKNILKVHETLTPQEVKLSFMLKNGLDTKGIANLTFREISTVKVARSRLRKKLNLDSDDNLTSYLQKF